MVQQLISRRHRGPPVLWISCVRDLFELVSRNAFNGRLGGLSCKYIPDAKRALYAGEHVKVASEGPAVPDSPWARGRRLAVAMLDSQHRLKDSTSRHSVDGLDFSRRESARSRVIAEHIDLVIQYAHFGGK